MAHYTCERIHHVVLEVIQISVHQSCRNLLCKWIHPVNAMTDKFLHQTGRNGPTSTFATAL